MLAAEQNAKNNQLKNGKFTQKKTQVLADYEPLTKHIIMSGHSVTVTTVLEDALKFIDD